MTRHSIRLCIAMRPTGQERARHATRTTSTGRIVHMTFTPDKTRTAARMIRAEWIAAGRPRIPAGVAFSVIVRATMQRPAGHTRADGSRAAAWRDVPRRPDVDNILKLVLDALQPDCIPDDALCVYAVAEKRYGDRDQILVEITTMEPSSAIAP